MSEKNNWKIGSYSQGKGQKLYFKGKLVAYLNMCGWICCSGVMNAYSSHYINCKPDEILEKK